MNQRSRPQGVMVNSGHLTGTPADEAIIESHCTIWSKLGVGKGIHQLSIARLVDF